jgi:hypothetical protein
MRHRDRSARVRVPRHAVAAALLGLLGCGAGAGRAAVAQDPLAREVDRLRAELQLAREGAFYVRLDPVGRTLELALGGAVLERYPTLAIERGTPRAAFRRRDAPDAWDRVGYHGGRLEPPRERERVEIRPPAGAAPAPPPLPPTAEESVSVPARWRVVFAEGLSLEVEAPGGARHRGPLRRTADVLALWWRRLEDAVARGERGRVWLRVRLSDEHAAALYRALPPDVGLVLAGAGPA